MPSSTTRAHRVESISTSPNHRPTSISLTTRSPWAWRFRCPTPIYRRARFGRRRCGRPYCPICSGRDRGHDDQLDHGTEPQHQLRVLNSTPLAPLRAGQAALLAADAPARPRRTIVATDTRRRTATSTRRLHRPVGVVAWLPPHSTRRSPFLEIEINRFQVGVDPIARVGYDAQRIFQVVDQRAKAALSSGREEGADLRIRRRIFGREVFFSGIFTPR